MKIAYSARFRFRIVLLLSLAALLLGVVWISVRVSERHLRVDLLQQAKLVANGLDVARIKALAASPADLASPDYQYLKNHFIAVGKANPKCRWLYLMGRKAAVPADAAAPSGSPIFFFVDSEEPDVDNASPPGQIYDEAPPSYRLAFDCGKDAVVGPVSDRWGSWITALVPLLDPSSGAVDAVLGVDVDAAIWKWDVVTHTALPIALLLLLLIAVMVFFFTAGNRAAVAPKPVMRRLLPPLAIMVCFLVVAAGALLYQQHRQRMAMDIAADLADAMGDLDVATDEQIKCLVAAARPIAADAALRTALRSGDTNGLFALWQPVFESMRREGHIDQLSFLDTNRVCLLRVHQPEACGDTVDRFTVIEAQRTGKAASGIEIGTMGFVSLRAVQPVFDGDLPVGYVELGKGIDDVLDLLHTRSGNFLAISICKEYLDRQRWEQGMRLQGKVADWDRLPHSVITFASQGYLPDAFAPLADHDEMHSIFHNTGFREIVSDENYWHVGVSPLSDASGREVGDLVVMRNVTAEKDAFARLLITSGAAGFIVLAVLLGFIYILLYRTDAGIRSQQAALRLSEQKYRLLVDNSTDIIYRLDVDGVFTFVSAAWSVVLGYPTLNVDGLSIKSIIHPDDLPVCMASLQRLITTGQRGPGIEYRVRHYNGTWRWHSSCATIVQDEAGTIIGFQGIARDVGVRKMTEAYRELGRNILSILNESGRFNDAIRRIISTLRTQTGFDAVGIRLQNGDDFPYVMQEGFSDDFLQTENSIVERDASGCVCRDGDGNVYLDCTCGLVISNRAKPDSQLFTRGGSFWTNDSAALLDLPPSQDPRWHPRTTCVREGYASVALVPIRKLNRTVGLLHFDDHRKGCFTLESVELLEGIAAHIGEALQRKQTEEALYANERSFRLLFESMASVFAMHKVIRDKDGNPCDARFIMVNRAFETVTGIKADDAVGRTVREVMPNDAHLLTERFFSVATTGVPLTFEHYDSARGRHLEFVAYCPEPEHFAVIITDITERKQSDSERERIRKLESVGTLAGGIAHDFNNILMGLFGSISLAKEVLDKNHPVYADLEEAEKAMNRAVRLTKRLLTFAKGGEPLKEDVNLCDLVDEVARFDLSGSTVRLVCRHEPAVWFVDADKGQIQQVVSNLVMNARQAMPDGGCLYISLENSDVAASAIPHLRQGRYVKLTVRDEGGGIDPKYIDRLFEPYFTTKPTGRGLGLATAHSIARRHGGCITVASEPGKGASFTVYLPASGHMPRSTVQSASLCTPLVSPARILIMDDDPTVCSVVVHMLTPAGFSVASASDGAEAIEMYKQAMQSGVRFDVVVMDLTVPGGMGGKDAVKSLLLFDPHATVVVSSGYADDPVMANYAEYGFKGVVEKPYTKSELQALLVGVMRTASRPLA